MSPNHFYKGLSWLLMLNVLVKPLWVFAIDRVVQNRVGYEAYGSYFSMLGLCMSLGFLADAGLTNMINRELANGTALNIRSILKLKILFSFIYAGLVCFIGVMTHIADWALLLPLIIIQVLASYLLFFRAMITAQQFFKKDAWLSVLDKALMIVSCGILLHTTPRVTFTLSIFLYLQTVALAIAVCVAAYLAVRHGYKDVTTSIKPLMKKALPFVVLILLMSAHNRIDAFLLGWLHADGAYQAGIYAAAYRLLDAGNMIGYLVAAYLVPFAARNLDNKKLLTDVGITLRHALLFLACVLIAFAAVFSYQIQQWLYPSLAPSNPYVLLLCIATLPAYYLTHIYGSLLTAAGALKTFTCIVAVALFINMGLNFFLISKGAVGCALAALISQALCALGCMVGCNRKMKIALKPLSFCLVAGGGGLYWALFYFGNKSNFPPLLLIAIAVVLTALLMFAWWQRINRTLTYT